MCYNEWKFASIPEVPSIFLLFLTFLSKYMEILQFSNVFREIPTKFHQNLAEKWQNSSIFCWNEMK